MIEVDSKKIKMAILFSQMTVGEVAQLAGLNAATLTKILAGNCRVRFKTAARLAQVLKIQPTEIIKEE